MICVALVVAPAPAAYLSQMSLASEQIDSQEEDEVPVEEQCEAEAILPRKRSRDDLVRLYDGMIAKLMMGKSSSACCGPRSPNLTGIAGELVNRNGCRAILRC